YVFFFSTRRRHTKSYGDWSSDVCSSDLSEMQVAGVGQRVPVDVAGAVMRVGSNHVEGGPRPVRPDRQHARRRLDALAPRQQGGRSEERRVGKEWKTRRAGDQ